MFFITIEDNIVSVCLSDAKNHLGYRVETAEHLNSAQIPYQFRAGKILPSARTHAPWATAAKTYSRPHRCSATAVDRSTAAIVRPAPAAESC